MGDTLILNPSGLPVRIAPWEDVITLWCKGRVDILYSDENKVLRSPSFEMNMPVVVQLKNEFARRIKKRVPFSRRNVIIRDNGICQYCGIKLSLRGVTFDHVIPRCSGGLSSWSNFVVACEPCNFKKGGRTPEQAGMRLIRKPAEPDPRDPRFEFRLSIKKIKPEWRPWENYLYWNVELEQ